MSNNGKKNSYYNIKANEEGYVDVDAICSQLDLSFAAGNCIKAIFGIFISKASGENRHNGTSAKRDANKLVTYAEQVRQMVENNG